MTKILSRRQTHQNGFTMIELLVVTTIIIILTTIGIVSYRAASIKSRNSKRQADLETLRQALVLYRSQEGEYPPSSNYSDAAALAGFLQSEGYLGQGTTFSDPKTDASYTYVSDGTVFSLGATLEPDDTSYTATNP